MLLPESKQFLNQIMSHVKFPFDKIKIADELEAHIYDKKDYYIEKGFDSTAAERQAIADMGDAREIGMELNRQHHPVIGWLSVITKVLLVIIVLWNVFFVGTQALSSLRSNPINKLPDSEIVYSIDVNETVRLDDTFIKFKKIVLDKTGTMHIAYEHYNKWILRSGWSSDSIGTITDNLGKEYFDGSSSSNGGIITKCVRSVDNFNIQAKKLIITYDSYNRNYRIEIPLKEVK